jgi:hypothetical protein
MTKTFKSLSALLAYPTEELQAAASECRDAVLSERLLSSNGWRSASGASRGSPAWWAFPFWCTAGCSTHASAGHRRAAI